MTAADPATTTVDAPARRGRPGYDRDGILAVARCGQTRQEDLIEFAKSVAAMRRSVTATLLFDDRVPG